MKANWNVVFKLDRSITTEQIKKIEELIIPTGARKGEGNTTVVGMYISAPTGLDAVNQVGGRLRKILGTNNLGVIDVQVSKQANLDSMIDAVDDLNV